MRTILVTILLMCAASAQAQVRPTYLGWHDNAYFASSGVGNLNKDESTRKRGGGMFTAQASARLNGAYLGSTTGYFTSSQSFQDLMATNQSFTIAFWHYHVSGMASGYLLGASDNVNQWQYLFNYNSANTNLVFQQYNGTQNPTYRGQVSYTAGWHYIVGVRDTAIPGLLLYFDGQLVTRAGGVDTGSTLAYQFNRTLTLMAVDGGAGKIAAQDSMIMGIRIWDRALTAKEISILYEKRFRQ
jgi:hypothetical protein